MAWSTITIGMASSKPEDGMSSLLSRSSYKVSTLKNIDYPSALIGILYESLIQFRRKFTSVSIFVAKTETGYVTKWEITKE